MINLQLIQGAATMSNSLIDAAVSTVHVNKHDGY